MSVLINTLNHQMATGTKLLFDFLIKTKQDEGMLISLMNVNKNKSILYILSTIRDKKIQEKNIKLNSFIELYNTDKKEALEELFQEPIYNSYIDLIKNNNIIPEELFFKFINSKNKLRLLRYIL